MNSLRDTSLESNPYLKINFDGGDLSSDAGLLLIKEFAEKIGLVKLVYRLFKTNDPALYRFHIDPENLLQMIYQTIGAYFEDDCADGYHPLLCFDGITGDLLKLELRDGTHYCSKGADKFMIPLMQEFRTKHPSLPLYLRGDSGFASPELYDACEDNDCKYAIRLKINKTLIAFAEDKAEALRRATMRNMVDYAVTYGEFMYQANTWKHPRRVVFKIEKPQNQMTFMYTFIVTNMESEPYKVIQFYCGRGKMENFIKEGKDGFDFSAVSSKSKIVNANRLRLHALAYNLFNWFRRLALAANMRKLRIDTVRLKLMKIAARAVHSARYTTFKLCSSCPYKDEFYETLQNIRGLQPQME